MDREQIEDVVADLMMDYGPDKHIDGYNVISDFIVSIIEGKEEEWVRKYRGKDEEHLAKLEKLWLKF